jgi:hypothetical protein
MPNTTNFNWPTPADTDLVKDGAAAIRNLGNGVDTSLVDLKGGTTGQILSKASNADMDFAFITPNVGDLTEVQAGVGISVASGTGPIPIITNSSTDLITTAGDLLYGTAADTVARLGIGTAGQVLKVNSGATAPEWASAAAVNTFSGVSVYKSGSAQSISNATETVITFESERFDTDGYHSTVSNTSRITVPSGKNGYFLLTGTIRFANNSGGSRFITFLKNGTIQIARCNRVNAISSDMFLNGTAIIDGVAGDYFEMQAQQSSGGSLNIEVTESDCNFSAFFIGA